MSIIKICIRGSIFIFLFFVNSTLFAERVRVSIKDIIEVSSDNPLGVSTVLSYNDSVMIRLRQDLRFIRGIELELTAPQNWLPNSGGMAFALYSNLNFEPGMGYADIEAARIIHEPVPSKIQTVYHIPLRDNHGLRGTHYLTLLKNPVFPENFPLIFRLTPNLKGWSKEIETMRFQLNVKPIFSDEGSLVISVKRPEFMPNGNFITLIDEQVVENPGVEMLLKEGEHTLTLISSDYRTENRRFIIERGNNLHLSINLHDLTPLIIFEAPELARVFIDNTQIARTDAPMAVEPGVHTIRIQVSDYSIVKTVVIEKGKTYRIAFIIDMQIAEE
jgi:hypothetical protein